MDLIQAVDDEIASVTADAAYDTLAFYDTAAARGATVVVPPKETARLAGRGSRSPVRDRTIEAVNRVGRRQWKKDAGYHRQARVENAFFRYKSIFGGRLRAASPRGQAVEALVACNILNRMTAMGRPASYAIGQRGPSGWGRCGSVPDSRNNARVLREPSVSEFQVRRLGAQLRMVQQCLLPSRTNSQPFARRCTQETATLHAEMEISSNEPTTAA